MLHCSFCGKDETKVAKLVAGPKVFICDECVEVAARIMREYSATRPTFWHKLWMRLKFWERNYVQT